MKRIATAIIGSGNIGSDLVIKLARGSQVLEPTLLVGIDPDSDGLARARAMGVDTTHNGLAGLLEHPRFDDIRVVFDATTASAHAAHDAALRPLGRRLVDLTPAALGPYVVPVVNGGQHIDAPNLNMVTCGGQATVPIVAAVSRVARVHWGEIVASIASRSAGPGTRANIDEFTVTTARAIEQVGGTARGKAIIILNPANPPILMRDTVHCLCDDADPDAIRASIVDTVRAVQSYVPGYQLAQEPVVEDARWRIPGEEERRGKKVSVFLRVEGNGDYLPKYAGNLDIMTAAAMRTGELVALRMRENGRA